MITRRRWGRLVLGCILTLGLAQEALAETAIVQAGRRRAATRETTTDRNTNRHRRASTEATGNQQAWAASPHPLRQTASSAERDGEERTDPLLQLTERAIARTSQRHLDADQHTPWQIMHGVVALRRDFDLTRGAGKINCIEFLSDAPKFRGEDWWQVTEHGGRAHPFSVPYAFEGHPNQFLALLSNSNLPLTHEFRVDARHTVTMADMVENARMTVNNREEITWTLWFLTHYIDIDEEWINAAGESWSMEELVRIQTASKVTGTACGGCHGLYAIAYARNAYLQKHGRLRGVYYQAEQKLNRYIELARTMQNYDGSFSTEFFKGTGHSRDFNERLKASGHMLEWLMMALPAERLDEPWVRKAVASIATDLIHNASQPAECGPLYHALNSLIMYRDRAHGEQTPLEESLELAETTPEADADTSSESESSESESSESKSSEPETPAETKPLPPQRSHILTAPPRKMQDTPRKPTLPAPTDVSTAQSGETPEPTPATPAESASAEPTPTEPTPTEPTPAEPAPAEPDPAEVLARKAARKLVETIRKGTPIAEAQPPDDDDDSEPPGLLQAPDAEATRLATEPKSDSIVR